MSRRMRARTTAWNPRHSIYKPLPAPLGTRLPCVARVSPPALPHLEAAPQPAAPSGECSKVLGESTRLDALLSGIDVGQG
eukprot:1422974-Pyramimonas_sp.AAC.1